MSDKLDKSKQMTSGSKVSREQKLKEMGWDVSGDIPNQSGKSRLDLPVELKNELDSLGLVARFINARTYKEVGFHKSDWKPYAFNCKGKFPNMDVDGFYTSQDLILAVKPVEYNNAHRKFLDNKNKQLAKANETAAAELRSSLKSAGIDGVVTEGYEEN